MENKHWHFFNWGSIFKQEMGPVLNFDTLPKRLDSDNCENLIKWYKIVN